MRSFQEEGNTSILRLLFLFCIIDIFLGEISVPMWHSSDALLFSHWSTRVAALYVYQEAALCVTD